MNELPTIQKTEIDNVKAGRIVRDLRISVGKSLRWLADELEVSAPFLSDMELGRRGWSKDRFEQAIKILNAVKPRKTK